MVTYLYVLMAYGLAVGVLGFVAEHYERRARKRKAASHG